MTVPLPGWTFARRNFLPVSADNPCNAGSSRSPFMPTLTGLRPSPPPQGPRASTAETEQAATRVASTEHTAPPPSLPPRPVQPPRTPSRGLLERTFSPAIERTLDVVVDTVDRLTAAGRHAPLPSPEERAVLAGRQASLGELLGTPAARVGGGEAGGAR